MFQELKRQKIRANSFMARGLSPPPTNGPGFDCDSYGCGSKIGPQNGLADRYMKPRTKTCGPVPGGFILTHAHTVGGQNPFRTTVKPWEAIGLLVFVESNPSRVAKWFFLLADSNHYFQPSFFSKTDRRFRWVSGGFLEDSDPWKGLEGSFRILQPSTV